MASASTTEVFNCSVSDFYKIGKDAKRHLIQLNKHNDVMALFIADPFELSTPLPGHYGINNNDQTVVLNTNKSSEINDMHNKQFKHLDLIYENIQKSGVPVIPIMTNDKLQERIKHCIKSPSTAWSSWRKNLGSKTGELS